MLLTVILSLLLLMLIYLLLAPIILYINSSDNDYYVRLPGILKACLLADKEEVLKVKIKILFMSFYFYPLRKDKAPKELKKIEGRAARKKRKRTMNFKMGLRLLRSFKVKRFFVNIDTGDCISNAKLYPVFAFLNYRYGGFAINFENKNELILKLQNRPIYIIKSFINK
ncbi:MAG: hypothetical protein QNJ57_12835 [Flavobacteriaceae bacterium]|nr:hypothetical protein [Flavobacteriaceae bacterium]